MKKTEKIEVRLSHEEKTALTTLAEQEGRTVSELVRGLVERYMSVNTSRLPRKTPWMKFVAIGVVGFFAGHLVTYLIAKSHDQTSIYNMGVQFGGDRITFSLLEKPGDAPKFVIPAKKGDILISPKIERESDSLASVTVEMCRKSGSTCQAIAKPTLQFDPNSQNSVSFEEDSGEVVYVFLNKHPMSR